MLLDFDFVVDLPFVKMLNKSQSVSLVVVVVKLGRVGSKTKPNHVSIMKNANFHSKNLEVV